MIYQEFKKMELIWVLNVNKLFKIRNSILIYKIEHKILGGGYGICVEHTTVDPINKIMVLKSQNVSYRKIFSINEVCTYSVDKNNLNFTQLLQSAKVVAFPFGLASLIEKFSADKFRSNATQGRAIMDSAIARVVTESKEAIDCLIRETEDIFATEHLMDSMNLSKE